MDFIITLAIAAAVSYCFSSAIKNGPEFFYVAALALNAIFLAADIVDYPRAIDSILLMLMQRGNLALAFFTVVMFVGCLPNGSDAKAKLAPIRSELSIIACLLTIGHVVQYFTAGVLFHLVTGTVSNDLVLASFAVAIVLTAIMAVLFVTSFRVMRHNIPSTIWKKTHRLAYVFFALVFLHVLLMLSTGAFAGSTETQIRLAAYMLVPVVYLIARAAKHVSDRRIIEQ